MSKRSETVTNEYIFDGFVTVASISPEVKPGNCMVNAAKIYSETTRAVALGAKIICAPELSITGYTCGDLFLQDSLLADALVALKALARSTQWDDTLIFVGLPVSHMGKLYNVAAVIQNGEVIGMIPKSYPPNYGEFYELRYFTPAFKGIETYIFEGERVPFGTDLLFKCNEFPELVVAAEICEDLWVADPPSSRHSRAGATVIANLSASDETIGKEAYRKLLARAQSGGTVCAYVYANAGYGESTGDMVFSGHGFVCENAKLLSERRPFTDDPAIADVDIKGLLRDRRYMNTFERASADTHVVVPFSQKNNCKLKYRYISPHPFVPSRTSELEARCEEIICMQSSGLSKRLEHVGVRKAIVSVSGGLDSTLALLITARALHLLGRRGNDVIAVFMQDSGTTHFARQNAENLCKVLGVELHVIDIAASVAQHLRDISHSPEDDSFATFENVQTRIRTIILMDLANKHGGLVVGNNDMTELALGWTTYGGDHMSMYGVNSSVPKTIIRHIIEYILTAEPLLAGPLNAILNAPVGHKLSPAFNSGIRRSAEDVIGPYELHDFFLYHMIRWGREPSLILKLAYKAFNGWYDESEIREWFRTFYRRFFDNQFKRNAMPDGPKIGSVALSPRADWRMPSDADGDAWFGSLR